MTDEGRGHSGVVGRILASQSPDMAFLVIVAWLNHAFRAERTDETLSPLVLQTISDWILAQTNPSRTGAP